ncbi:hypothetical protein SAMN05216266_1205 [Amycolatopsis marina]|uniref:BNR/Asp-box repeat-containing protein n=2 Tax=Amycolatopsis marina TaxID=490629 RepID=A0A1I1C1L2_9PSEU|nr:hypothetical protein [Amycolatopsis marina]SFB56529.1 hypothetical protein SAMN05216266_1205 [Amycolatopsis marina]
MGFTIVGQEHFLGSGHPDPEEADQPNPLGLIESTDGGRTWESVSLAGEVDFHALEAEHGLVYGYDSQSQQVMVSNDRENWDRRASLAMADFAVHPGDPEELLATTQQGLARSTDGGRTFAPVPGAPLMVMVDWSAEGGVVGVDPDGGVHSSSDGGTTWAQRGQVGGAPQAVSTSGPADVYVATESGIHASQDAGRTFTLR